MFWYYTCPAACSFDLVAQELESKHPDGLPRLDLVEDVGVDDPSLVAAARRVAALEQKLAGNAVHLAAAGSSQKCAHCLPFLLSLLSAAKASCAWRGHS